jgi:hypothetical protein
MASRRSKQVGMMNDVIASFLEQTPWRKTSKNGSRMFKPSIGIRTNVIRLFESVTSLSKTRALPFRDGLPYGDPTEKVKCVIWCSGIWAT